MNERNIEALAIALFQEQAQKPNAHVLPELLRNTGFWTMAERLAARGVLVPSALTAEDMATLPVAHSDPEALRDSLPYVVADLARIARGDPPPPEY